MAPDEEVAGSTEQEEIRLLRQIDAKLEEQIPLLQAIADGQTALGIILGNVLSTLQDFEAKWVAANTPPPAFATTAVLSIPGGIMGLTVDSTGQNAVLDFKDDKTDTVAPPKGDGTGLVVTITSSDTAVISVGAVVPGTDAASGAANFTAPLSFGTAGSSTLSATVANTSGAPLVDDDGTTPFKQPASIVVPVAGGQAVTADITEA